VEKSSNNNNFFKFQSKKDKSTLPFNKTTPSSSDGINMEDIFQALQHWATEKLIESKDEEEGENDQKEQSHETDDLHEKQVNSFSDISYGVEEEEDIEEIHISQCYDH
jgi:hypothetical protein